MRLIESIYSPKKFWGMGVPKGSLGAGGGDPWDFFADFWGLCRAGNILR